MNILETNNNFMKSMQHLFLQSQWINQIQASTPMTSIYSPLSSSTTSFSSPIKSEMSDQDEPLNLSMKDERNSITNNNNVFMPTMSLFMSPIFPGMFTRPMMPNMIKIENTKFYNNFSTLSNPEQKRRRVATVKTKKSRSFKCNLCRNVFTCLSTLSEHTLKEHGGYKCHICDTSFTQRSNLQRHALRHVGFKPYKCSVCSKEYYRKDHLIRHISFNHPAVNPKENIIQRLSSSESLNFIDTQSEEVMNSPHNSTQSFDQSFEAVNDEDHSSNEDNIFLSTGYDPVEEMSVDILN